MSAADNASPRKILVTSALPYANGPIHLGHLVEYIQTDIWARFQRMRGHTVYYVCADDAHGTPIMLKAEDEGVTPEQLIKRFGREHRRDFDGFLISFDNYHSTHSPENRHFSELIYARLKDGGHIVRRTITQLYDPQKNMFLPDRFIRGACPVCGAQEQYGDNCEACGSTYSPTDLIDPVSVVSGSRPSARESEQLFFKLGDFRDFLAEWLGGGHTQAEIANKQQELFAQELFEWDISRNAPYWGFEIPGEDGKYFYVWMDAPIGYLASFKNLCDREGIDFDAFMNPGGDCELYHFIGKDIARFHTLFWPAQLHGAGFRTPSAVWCHGFLTVSGQKMSKRHGTVSRFPHRQRPENVQASRHFYHRRDLSQASRPGILEILLRRQVGRRHRRLGLELGRLQSARQRRLGRQVGEHRQSMREFYRAVFRRPLERRTAGAGHAARIRRRRRRHRRGLRRPAVRQSGAPHHGVGRPRQSGHRCRQTVGVN